MGILGRHYLHTVATNFILKFVIGLIISVATSWALGPDGRGEYILCVLIVTTMTTLFNFGVPGTNIYFTAKKQFGKERLLKASIILAILISAVSFLLMYLLFQLSLFRILFPTDKLTPPIIASLGIVPIVLFNLFAQGIIVGENKIALNNYISLTSQGALAVVMAILYFSGILTVTSAIVSYACSHLITFSIILWTSFPSPIAVLRSRIRWSEYRTLLRFSATIHLGNLTQFFNYRLDAFIVNAFLGTLAVGLYGNASTMGETLWLLSASMASVLLPTVAGQHEKSKEIAVKAAVATFGVSAIGGIIAFLIGPDLILILFKQKFAGSIEPFLILVPAVVIFSITNVLATYLTGAGRPGFNAVIAFISFLFTVIFDILLIPRYGISGAAVASAISYTMSSVMTVFAFVRVSAMTGSEFIKVLRSMPADVRSIIARLRRQLGLAEIQSGNAEPK